jgi:truncated hemoglobin YjbI
MKMALTEQVDDERLRDSLIRTFTQMAEHMVNTQSQGGCPAHAPQGH